MFSSSASWKFRLNVSCRDPSHRVIGNSHPSLPKCGNGGSTGREWLPCCLSRHSARVIAPESTGVHSAPKRRASNEYKSSSQIRLFAVVVNLPPSLRVPHEHPVVSVPLNCSQKQALDTSANSEPDLLPAVTFSPPVATHEVAMACPHSSRSTSHRASALGTLSAANAL